MEINFESNHNLSLNTVLNIPLCVIAAKSVFQENNNYYLQVYLNKCLYEHKYDK